MKRPVNATQVRHKAGLPSPASQTLVRGLDVLEVVAGGPLALPALANRLGMARSTTHRLATALLERRYLTLVPREGYGLGPKLLELGSRAQEQTALVRVARPHLERLATDSLETALLWVGEGGGADEAGGVLLLERVAGHRRLLPALRVGERMGINASAPGFALMLDEESAWRGLADRHVAAMPGGDYLSGMRNFARLGYAFDSADWAEGVRSVAAPVRDVTGGIAAAIGLASAAQYLDESRLAVLGKAVAEVAALLSADLGFAGVGAARHTIAGRSGPKRAGGTNLPSDNEQFERAGATRHLEAGARSVHDPALQGSCHAANPDNGVTLRPATPAPAKSG
jgi:DNA-binding IclR family transcriptional regulator